jgi:hypothetical protein
MCPASYNMSSITYNRPLRSRRKERHLSSQLMMSLSLLERGRDQAKIPSIRREKLSLSAAGGLSFLPFFREGRKTKKILLILLILSKNTKNKAEKQESVCSFRTSVP